MTDNKISIEQMNKESEELTKKELANLLTHISNNPSLLKPKKFINYESDTTYTPSEDSSSEDDKLEIYKKDTEIDQLDKKIYYKNLHLTNLSLENTRLQIENEELKKVIEEGNLITTVIKNLADFSIEKTEDITDDNLYKFKYLIENQMNINKNQLDLIYEKIITISDKQVRNYFEKNIDKMHERLDEVYKHNNETINELINYEYVKIRLANLMFMLLGGILLVLAREILAKYKFII